MMFTAILPTLKLEENLRTDFSFSSYFFHRRSLSAGCAMQDVLNLQKIISR